MNRLWVRISLSNIGIMVFLIIVPMSIGILTQTFDEGIEFQELEFLEENSEENLAARKIFERFSTNPGRIIFQGLSRFFMAIAIISIFVGILSARGLTAPLNKLANAAKAIEDQDLSQRVDLKGSREIREVARAFNDMAAGLEKSEELRTNLLNDVAHELRTPLSVIQGNLRAILDDVYEMDKAEIARLYDQTRHLSRLVDDLRELALAEADQLPLNITSIAVVSWIKESVTAFRPVAEEKSVRVRLEILGEHTQIEGDQARLTQSLHNLLINALQHTPAESQITIQIEQDMGSFFLRVIDQGEGIDAEHIPNVFDRFYRTDPNRSRETGGTGLGLAITRAIIAAHGGKISVQSAGIGEGSKFTIELPLDTYNNS